MKRFYYIFIVLLGLALFSSCDDMLETNPTDKVSGPTIFEDAVSAESAINGIYRVLYTAGWSTNWAAENGGITALSLVANLMGDDHLMREVGNGWFYFDYAWDVRGDYVHKSGRSYAVWNFYYTIISNVNYIIANEETMGGDPALIKSVIGQAYAMRALAYSQLVQFYSHAYKGNENAPGVPVYTLPTTSASEGKPRGTVQQVYDQINSDIAKSITLLKETTIAQKHRSHIDYYVANGIKARIDLTQERFADANEAAKEALSKANLSRTLTVTQQGKFNNFSLSNVLWGVNIIADQTSGYASFYSHMDADAGMYGSSARQCVSAWLYEQIPSSDDRKNWWNGKLAVDESGNSNVSYGQLKFAFSDATTRTGDYILMRAEEMLLIQAEALCHLERYNEAREIILELGSKRDADYAARLASYSDSKSYNSNTVGTLSTLMDEILFQRRVELWGEAGRVFDLKRLKLAVVRDYEGSNHTSKLTSKDKNPGSKEFVLPLPQSELDGNPYINQGDQNPL